MNSFREKLKKTIKPERNAKKWKEKLHDSKGVDKFVQFRFIDYRMQN